MTDAPVLGFTVDGGIATLTLQHPTKPNPLSRELQRALLETITAVGADPTIRALVITGTGRAFCVGADLGEMMEAGSTSQHGTRGDWVADMMETFINPIVQALRALQVPVLCAINGAAAGAGVGLALAADIVLMARSSYLYLPFVPRLGIVPDMGSSWFLSRLLGRGRATALTLLGDRLGAEQAVQWGLAWSCSEDSALLAEALHLARRLAVLPAGSALETRRLYDAAERNGLDDQLAYERERQRELINSAAFDEGVRAFLEKRDPMFAPSRS